MDKKRLKCSKCGCDELHFVNVPYSEKGEAGIISLFQAISWILTVLSFLLFLWLGIQPGADQILLIVIGVVFFATIIFGTTAVILTAITHFIPYKNDNRINYICPCCGNVDAIENAIKNTDDTADS